VSVGVRRFFPRHWSSRSRDTVNGSCDWPAERNALKVL
jgi:hypothetical protein